MKLSGQFPPATRSERIQGWLGGVVIFVFLLPWIAIAVGCILVGIGSIFRGDTTLLICLPAGLALLILPTVLLYLERRWYPRISSFTVDGSQLVYCLAGQSNLTYKELADVRWISHQRSRAGKTRGFRVKFRDGSGIYFCRSLPNADAFAQLLRESSAKHTFASAPENLPSDRSRGNQC